MRVPMLDLAAVHRPYREELRAALDAVLASERYVLGPEVERFEAEAARALGAPYALGVSSGTDALLCALMALDIAPGDEVITSGFSFVAAAEVIARLGAIPRFIDLQPGSFNLDPEGVARAITPRTRAIVAVHLYGEPADLPALCAVAEQHGIPLVEDAAQAFGAALGAEAPRRVGTWGRAGCFSFFPSKPLGGLGDGGMIVTADRELFERCRRLRVHGATAKHAHAELGGNFRLDALQAAALRTKLRHFEGMHAERQRLAARYLRELAGLAGAVLPTPRQGTASAWALFTLRLDDRDRVAADLARAGVESAVHYPEPLHRQPAFRALARAADPLPEAERAARQVLSIPLFPGMNDAQQDAVIEALFAAITARG
ncbi:MAG TPA: DegT/DnrJ/EryC1/StrS family aminotransferase [Polyangiaceae bacterium]|nr:DegT/DnrJ/EryC1/StrS family aminotransferase [Polyangiaceae bacterium]